MSRSGPTGIADTTAPAVMCSPVAVVTMQPPRSTRTSPDRCAVADPVAERRGHPQRDGRRTLGDPLALPHVVVVEAAALRRRPPCAGRRAVTCARPTRRPSASMASSRARTTLGVAPAARSHSPTLTRVQRRGVRMRPRVVRVDGRGQRGERGLDLRRRPSDRRRVNQGMSGPTCRPSASSQVSSPGRSGKDGTRVSPSSATRSDVRGVERPDHLAAELDQPPVGERGLLDPAAGSPASLQHDHVGAARDQVAGGRQAG